MPQLYVFEIAGTAIFAITGVLVITRRGLDMFGAMVLGVVTALGGGTVRDLIIRVPVFWTNDFNYVWAGLAGALAAFWIRALFRSTYRALLYLDGLGAALFAVAAAQKVLALQMSGPIAVAMGILTGIGGGLIRDVLAGRPTLLMTREIYATPILAGCALFVLLRSYAPGFDLAGPLSAAVIFGIRAFAIHHGLEIPSWLTIQEEDKN
ncbi:MAG TPA: TRIC cation channel family protein [Vicinamibacterales bacterium]|nr:TRIC cation channel family protein [Vicinamibacterales bacterium]